MGRASIGDPALVLLAGRDRAALLAAVERLLEAVDPRPIPTPPPRGGVRLAILAPRRDLAGRLRVARDRLAGSPDRLLSNRRQGIWFGEHDAAGRIAFLFPGQGSQHPRMLEELRERVGSVRRWFDALDRAYERFARTGPATALLGAAPDVPADARRARERALFDLGRGSQLGTVASLALHEILGRLALAPDVVVGHSNGEHAAIVAAGLVAAEDAGADALCEGLCRLALPASSPAPPERPEAMLAVSAAGRPELESLVEEHPGELFLAMDNCPRQQVLAGLRAAIEASARVLAARGRIATPLPFDRAYHSPLFAGWARALEAYYRSLRLVPPRVPVHSCLTGEALPDDPDLARRHMVEQWTSRVEFRRTIERLHDDGVRTFVEVGPGDTLTAFVQDTLRGRPHLASSASSAGIDDLGSLLRLMAELHAHGVPVDPAALERLLDPVASGPAPVRAVRSGAAVVGRRRFARATDPWVADHSFGRHATGRSDVVPLAVVPFTVSLAVAAGVAERAGTGPVAVLSALRAHRFLALDGGSRAVDLEAEQAPEGLRVRLSVRDEGPPGPAFEAFAHPGLVPAWRDDLVAGDPEASAPARWDAGEFYRRYAFHGPSLRSIERVARVGPRGIEADLVVPPGPPGARAGRFDPAVLDAAGQLVAFWLLDRAGLEPTFGIFPYAIDRAEAFAAPGPSGTRLSCRGVVEFDGAGGTRADFAFVGEGGEPIAALTGLRQRLVRFPEPLARRFLAGEWADLSAGEPAGPDRAVRRLEFDPLALLFRPEGPWARALAHVALAETELGRWLAHPGSLDERVRWLLERIAAKEAYRSLAAALGSVPPDLPEIAILGDVWIDAPSHGVGPARLVLSSSPGAVDAEVLR